MGNHNASVAEAYYKALAEKNVAKMENYLDENVQFTTPLAHVSGKKAYLETVKNFTVFFNALTIRATFGSGNQAVVVYDVDFPNISNFPSAALLTFNKELINRIELFYDARPFGEVQNKVFSK